MSDFSSHFRAELLIRSREWARKSYHGVRVGQSRCNIPNEPALDRSSFLIPRRPLILEISQSRAKNRRVAVATILMVGITIIYTHRSARKSFPSYLMATHSHNYKPRPLALRSWVLRIPLLEPRIAWRSHYGHCWITKLIYHSEGLDIMTMTTHNWS